ncbi:MAG: hypothetical protein IJ829_03030, partial [Kiritimatiellae bacterium]|nr:hypothetical protein [Kiritimatiellia bacterium]
AAIAGFAAFAWLQLGDAPLEVRVVAPLIFLFPVAQLLWCLFGKRTMTLDHGEGVTFVGVGPIGVRKRFQYGGAFDVELAESGVVVNGRRMNEIVVSKPGGRPAKLCTTWPNDVKPYLVAVLRHPEAVIVSGGL